jgi:hypothetical protein
MSAAGVRRSLLLLQGRRALAQLGLLQQQQCLMQLPALGLRWVWGWLHGLLRHRSAAHHSMILKRPPLCPVPLFNCTH